MKYFYRGKFAPEKLPKLNIDRQTVSLVPAESRVLEIGCADGFMGEYFIKEKGCKVTGVETDKEAAKQAQKRGLSIIVGDIEEKTILDKLKAKGKFQVILCSSIIEHLRDPINALKAWRDFLGEEGFLLATVPNIGHWSARLKILSGKFPSEEYGIFDESHLHFFTLDSFKKMIEDCGYFVEYLGIDPVGGGLPKISRFFSIFFPGLFAYQIVIKAKVFPCSKKPAKSSS